MALESREGAGVRERQAHVCRAGEERVRGAPGERRRLYGVRRQS